MTQPCPHAGDLSSLTTTVNEIKITLSRLSDILASNAVLEEKSTQFRKDINDIYRRLHVVEITVATYFRLQPLGGAGDLASHQHSPWGDVGGHKELIKRFQESGSYA